jgi:multiple sugar transport system substrate-binding protein
MGDVQRAVATLVTALALLAAGCGGSSGGGSSADSGKRSVTVWIGENQPDRVQATRANAADFTRRTGIEVDLVVLGDDELPSRTAKAVKARTLPDVMQVGMADAHAFVKRGVLDADLAQQTVEELGEDTFSARALSLLTTDGRVAAVPSDGWGQLLIYRRDLFDRAGLAAPQSLAEIRRAARKLNRRGLAGITLGTAPDGFTAETFEHVALAAGCQLVDDAGNVALTSPPCLDAFARYVELARDLSPGGTQDVDTTRDTYFSGRAAMIMWSPFLLDAMAGLRDDAKPNCPECKADPAYLARNSGLVGPLLGPGGAPVQFGNIATWGITRGADAGTAKRFVRYMMSDGYLRWLALSPQGKYPVRSGDAGDPQRFEREWAALESGVDRHAQLSQFYSEASIASLGDGVRNFRRWAFEDGEAALLGALSGPQPITKALAAAIQGDITPAQAAREAQAGVSALQDPR